MRDGTRDRLYNGLLLVRGITLVAWAIELMVTIFRSPLNPDIYAITLGIAGVTIGGRMLLDRGRRRGHPKS